MASVFIQENRDLRGVRKHSGVKRLIGCSAVAELAHKIILSRDKPLVGRLVEFIYIIIDVPNTADLLAAAGASAVIRRVAERRQCPCFCKHLAANAALRFPLEAVLRAGRLPPLNGGRLVSGGGDFLLRGQDGAAARSAYPPSAPARCRSAQPSGRSPTRARSLPPNGRTQRSRRSANLPSRGTARLRRRPTQTAQAEGMHKNTVSFHFYPPFRAARTHGSFLRLVLS